VDAKENTIATGVNAKNPMTKAVGGGPNEIVFGYEVGFDITTQEPRAHKLAQHRSITNTHISDVSPNPIFNGRRQIKAVIMLIQKATTMNRNCLLIPANAAETATIIISQNNRLIRYCGVSIDASISRRTFS
jgi:hypothetical protein